MDQRGYQVGFFDSYEGVRDPHGRRRKAEKIAYLLRAFGGRPLETAICLDVGCASGLITASLAPVFARTLGVEYDAQALRHAPRTADTDSGRLTFVQGDAMRLPAADASVDVVICAQVYEHVPDDVRLAAEVHRVLRPGGIVFFSGPNKLFPIEPHYFLPFLHWLPPRWADRCLRWLRRGERYYERSRTWWGLRRLWSRFTVRDVTVDLLQSNPEWVVPPRWAAVAQHVPRWLWNLALVALPNFNWLLIKEPEQRTSS